MERQTKKLCTYLILPLALLVAAVSLAYFQSKPDFLMHAEFFDVGQGDAEFVRTFMGSKILIDGGPSDQVLQELGKNLPFYDRAIDLVVLTHPHADHISGLIDVLKRFEVKKILLPNVKYDSSAYKELLDLADQKHIEKIYALQGQRIWLDSATVLDVLYPAQKLIDATQAKEGFGADSIDLNNTSIVAQLIFGKIKILFTGDAGSDVESALSQGFDLKSDILKVAHHGSKYSNSSIFFDDVKPEFAVIEVGKDNSYGHPAAETLDGLFAVEANVLRTDLVHTVEFTSNGEGVYKN